MLKKTLTKAAFEALPDVLKAEYRVDGDGYALDLDGADDAGAAIRARDHEKAARKDAEAKLKELQATLDASGADGARKAGDVKALDSSWQAKFDGAMAEMNAKVAALTQRTERQMIDGAAAALAAKISTAPALMARALKERLSVDHGAEGGPALRVLGADGKLSALSVDDLGKEFSANKDFASVIIGSKASGGAGGIKSAPTAQPGADMSRMKPTDLAAYITAKREASA